MFGVKDCPNLPTLGDVPKRPAHKERPQVPRVSRLTSHLRTSPMTSRMESGLELGR